MDKYPFCVDCPLLTRPFVPNLFPTDPLDKRELVLIVGEAPGRNEAEKGRPFIGSAGKVLASAINGIPRYDDFKLAYSNVVCCHPVDDKTPPSGVIMNCAQNILFKQIEHYKPWRIIAMGNPAIGAFGGGFSGVTEKRGVFTEHNGIPVFLTLHPAGLMRRVEQYGMFCRDLVRALGSLEPETPPDYKVLTGVDQTVAFLKRAEQAQVVVIDTETTGLDAWRDEVICISLAVDGSTGYAVFVPLLQDERVQKAFRDLFALSLDHEQLDRFWKTGEVAPGKVAFVGHNFKFDQKMLHYLFGAFPEVAADTMVMHSVVYPGESHGLKLVAADLCGADHYEDNVHAQRRYGTFLTVDQDVLAKYAAWDAAYNYRVFKVLFDQMLLDEAHRNLGFILSDAERALLRIELHGCSIDMTKQKQLAQSLRSEIKELLTELRKMCGDDRFNPNSSPQTAAIIYDQFNLKPRIHVDQQMSGRRQVSAKKRPERTTDAAFLETVSYHPFAQAMLKYRKVTKLYGTYVRKLPKRIDSDQRLHSTFNLHVTITGRLSSVGPNFQNLPHVGGVRDMFSASVGNVMLQFDFSQLEYRVAAWISRDNWMITQYQAGRDLHGEVAIALFGEDYTDLQRTIAKGINFGILYGISAQSLALGQGITERAANEYIRTYFRRVPQLRAWILKTQQSACTGQTITSPIGRRWRWPIITYHNKGEVERCSVNYPIQGTASDLTIMSLSQVQRELNDYLWVVSTVHDSIYVETIPENVPVVVAEVKSIMESVPKRVLGDLVPFVADVKIGSSMLPMDKYTADTDVDQYIRRL